MDNVIITGTSRGIGLALTEYALNRGHKVLAVARAPSSSPELTSLVDRWPKTLEVFELDLETMDADSKLAARVDHWERVDILINNAGILQKGESLEDFQKSFHINSVVPFFLIKTLIKKLRASQRPRAVQISSTMGSIGENQSGGYYTYRSSKAALNMIIKSLAHDEPWLTSVLMHPGWVQTGMGGKEAPLRPDESAASLWNIIEGLGPKDNGRFLDPQGKTLPW